MEKAIGRVKPERKSRRKKEKIQRLTLKASGKKYWDLYLMLIPVIAFFVLFKYIPMYGVQIAFQEYSPSAAFFTSPWVGFEHFIRFFKSFKFTEVLSNTVFLSFYLLFASFPAPIILALILNEMRNKYFKKSLQTITYAPHFLSTVVMVGMLVAFLDTDTGVINKMIQLFGMQPVDFISEEGWFRHLYVISHVWKSAGWGSIIYMATLSNINPQLYEAATIDGANRLKRLIYITMPCLAPTIVIMLIMDCGSIMNVGFEKVLLMQNSLNIDVSEVISTYVYKVGIRNMQFSYSAAIDLFNSVINLIMLLTVNKISRKFSSSSLW